LAAEEKLSFIVIAKSIVYGLKSKLKTRCFQLAQEGYLLLPCGIAQLDSRKVKHRGRKFSWPHSIFLHTKTLIPSAQEKRDNRDLLLGDVSHGGQSVSQSNNKL